MRKRIKDLNHENKYKNKPKNFSRCKYNRRSIIIDGSILEEYLGD
jgi:hypothetical protein